MNQLQNNAIALLEKAEARGDIKLDINHNTAEIAVTSPYTDYYIRTNDQGYTMTYYRYKWDDEADQMESWPYEEGTRVSDNLTELAELIIDDVRN